MKLNAVKCKTAKPKDKPYKLSDGEGMYLEVMPNGSKYWRMKYRYANKEKRLAIGVYPEISLLEARDERKHARTLLREGKDPSLEKKKQKALSVTKGENTFETVAREWYELNRPKWTERYAEGVMTRLEAYIFPEIGSYPITDIEPPILLQVIRKIENRPAVEIAKRQLQKCGEIFRYAIACGKAVRDPSADIKGALKPQKTTHYAALSSKELPEFLGKFNRNEGRQHKSTHNAFRFLMLTFVRTSELLNATWEEIDFEAKQWVIPAKRMKMRKSHIVPLCRQAIEILEYQKENTPSQFPYVFPSPVRPRNPMSNNTMLKVIKSMGYQGRMTGHGFRALAMTIIKEELGYRHEVVDRQLAHAPRSKIDAAYDRAMFLEDRKKMMQDWADYLDGVTRGSACFT